MFIFIEYITLPAEII